MRVLIACEYSGRVRDAFAALGHEALSVDLLPSDRPGNHYQGDVFDVIDDGWDLMVAHPPCTYQAKSGASRLVRNGKVNEPRLAQLEEGAVFMRRLLESPIPRIAVENPIILERARVIIGRPHDQVIQPWQHGHGETKATCLWLKNLPRLVPTNVVSGREQNILKLPPSPDRWKLRSTTYQGIADAMASQWSVSLASLQVTLF